MVVELRLISLGAGVQSTTMALMAARGEITPMPDCAIFADTQSEPSAVYRHLNWLEKQLPFPVHHVTVGSLRNQILGAVAGKNRMDGRPPFFTKKNEAKGGMLRRQCTHDFKLVPIQRKIRELVGIVRGRKGPSHPIVEQWIGISTDEAARMKQSKFTYVTHCYPLIEMDMSRQACLDWCSKFNYPRPVKSACTFCPYTDNARWRELRDTDPEAFADVVAMDVAIRKGVDTQNAEWFIHASRKPLSEVDLTTTEERAANMFNDECEGMCGV